MKTKKIIALCLLVTITCSLIITPVIAEPKINKNILKAVKDSIAINEKLNKPKKQNNFNFKFSDSKNYLETMSWAIKAIEKLGAKGIICGYDDETYKPKENVKNIEALSLILRMTNRDEESKANEKIHPFVSKFKNQWNLRWGWGYIFVALDEGILLQEELKDFNPNKPIKRHEVAKYLIRAIGKTKEAEKNMNSELYFKDKTAIPDSSWGYVWVINDLGIMTGNDNNQFKPNEPLTRAEMAVLIDKAEGKYEEPNKNKNESQVKFLAYDYSNDILEVELYNGKKAYYKTIPNVIVYKDNDYTDVDDLSKGDILEVVLNNKNQIIFIEVVKEKAPGTPVKVEDIEFEVVSSELPEVIETKINSLKTAKRYRAFEYEDDIYLAAFMGKRNTGGYSISIDEVTKHYLGNGKYKVEAVVSEIEPDKDSTVTQAITYPYEVIKFEKLDEIVEIVFINEDGKVLYRPSLEDLNNKNTITGTISYLDKYEEYIKVLVNKTTYKYYISDDIEIFINDKEADFDELKVDMPVKLTVVNDTITKISVNYDKKEIAGTIYFLDKGEEYIKVLVNKTTYKYLISDDIEIFINDKEADFDELKVDMPVKLTVVNDTITKISVDYDEKEITGTIQYINEKTKEIRIKYNNRFQTYSVLNDVEIELNNNPSKLSDLKFGMSVVVQLINNKVAKIDAIDIEEIYEGKIIDLVKTKNIVKIVNINVDDTNKSFEIDQNTKIMIDGKKAKAEDLSVNGEVIVKLLNNKVVEIEEK